MSAATTAAITAAIVSSNAHRSEFYTNNDMSTVSSIGMTLFMIVCIFGLSAFCAASVWTVYEGYKIRAYEVVVLGSFITLLILSMLLLLVGSL
jgi:tellurite resistance protein TehA-like permease